MKTIAHVGWDGSDQDQCRVLDVEEWLIANRDISLKNDSEHDYINLINGRDFLAETKTYDIVILHFIFRGHRKQAGQLRSFWWDHFADFNVSELQSWENWRKRLASSSAMFIFPFGTTTEISGSYLVDVPGYKRIVTNTQWEIVEGNLSVFEKEPTCQEQNNSRPGHKLMATAS